MTIELRDWEADILTAKGLLDDIARNDRDGWAWDYALGREYMEHPANARIMRRAKGRGHDAYIAALARVIGGPRR